MKRLGKMLLDIVLDEGNWMSRDVALCEGIGRRTSWVKGLGEMVARAQRKTQKGNVGRAEGKVRARRRES